MKFKFKIQQYQTDAVNSVVQVFSGQTNQNNNTTYIIDKGNYERKNDLSKYLHDSEDISIGFANQAISLNNNQILKNIREIQQNNNLEFSEKLIDEMGRCSLDVEMETGTGKTYVYIKTIFELNKQYGWNKFIIVVPSIAIREGVLKNFDATKDHFYEYYRKKARFFVYNSKNSTEVRIFCQNAELSVMIINMQAFNVSKKEKRKFLNDSDELGSRSPLYVIKATNPILILDEPQKMGGAVTKNVLKEFNPLFTINYSATHKDHHNLVYVLDAIDAYKKKLVKKIQVKGFDIKNLLGTDGYLFLEEIALSPNKPPRARIEMDVRYKDVINRKRKLINEKDDLYELSNNMEQYKGYRVNKIDPIKGEVTFTNGKEIHTGEIFGDDNVRRYSRRLQIRETIQSHFEKEKELFDRDIKTLSLFFIDEVSNYRKYDADGNETLGEYGKIFEEEYNEILKKYNNSNTKYGQYLQKIDVNDTHKGYFSIDKKGHIINSRLKRNTDISDDESAYDLILKHKEKLLSFNSPVRFIFSHSALREGWDNPNIFQICTLKEGGGSTIKKRQEVGRGLRICVNKNGDRMDESELGEDVQHVNKLTVIASEGYDSFVSSLQNEIITDTDTRRRPKEIGVDFFIDKCIKVGDKEYKIKKSDAYKISAYLLENKYINEDDNLLNNYIKDAEDRKLKPLPDDLLYLSDGIHKLIQEFIDKNRYMNVENGRKTKLRENNLNKNFKKEEFQTLWKYINHKYTYSIDFDSSELIAKSIEKIDKNMSVKKLQIQLTEGTQGENYNLENISEGGGFTEDRIHIYTYDNSEISQSQVQYDLVGRIAEGTKLTRKSAVEILKNIKSTTFDMFKENPEDFIRKAITFINEEKTKLIDENINKDVITYHETDDTYDVSIFTVKKNIESSHSLKVNKHIQDYVITDGYAEESVEKRFAGDLDEADEVKVYAKLPSGPNGYQIPTPVGNYTPDWAIVFEKDSVKHIYFIAETKGSTDEYDRRKIEDLKIKCAKKLFNENERYAGKVKYDVVTNYCELLNSANQ